MVVVAQLVRAPDCGSGGRRFEPGLPPKIPKKNRDFLFKSVSCSIEMRPGEKFTPIDFL